MDFGCQVGTKDGKWPDKWRQAGTSTGDPRERVSSLRSKSGSQSVAAGFKFSQIILQRQEVRSGSVTPFPGIIGDPCGSGSLMARYRTVPLLDNRQILLFMNVAGPSSRHRQRISLSFVDYIRVAVSTAIVGSQSRP